MKRTKRHKKMPACQGCCCSIPNQKSVFSTKHQILRREANKEDTVTIQSNHIYEKWPTTMPWYKTNNPHGASGHSTTIKPKSITFWTIASLVSYDHTKACIQIIWSLWRIIDQRTYSKCSVNCIRKPMISALAYEAKYTWLTTHQMWNQAC